MKLLASGRDADVYELDEDRVLRRYRDGGDVAEEAAVMAYAGRHGVPVPEVYESGGADLVMERLAGPTLQEALLAGETPPAAGAEVLADLHTRLHALPARRSRDPATRILHLDLHPANVILSTRGPVLIDWRNATEGPPDLDVALTALIIAEVTPGSYEPGFVPVARELLAAFLDRAGGDPLSQLDRALARRAADSNLTAEEKARLAPATDTIRSLVGREGI
jgi:aminoglycoside phosphotransferase (APT) family kinase protein